MARKNRQRIPLQQANGAPTGATVSNNFYSSSTSKGPSQSSTSSSDPQRISTSSSLSTSSNASYPMIPSSSTTSIASISSIPSITSNESASTITPSSSASSSALPRPASNARNTSSNSNSNLNGALATGPTTPGSGGGGVSARGGARSVGSKQRASNPDYTNDRSSSANGSESMLLPRLPSLEDFDIPFLNSDSFSSSISSSSFSPSPTTTFSSSFTSFLPSTSTSPPGSSSSSAYSRPLLSSFAPTSSQYLTSQSSRVQDFHHSPPNSNSTPVRNTRPSVLSGISSNHSNSSIRSNLQQQQQQRPPSMYSQTTIDATGTILQQQGPLELTRLEASDYFIHNTNEDFLPKKLTVRSASSRNTEDNSIHSNNSSIHTNNNDPLDARGRTQRSDDLLSPPRYVIRQPSLSGLSKASRATSPSPSLTSSVLSDDSSVHSSLQHHQQLQQLRHQRQPQRPILDTPTSQQQTSQSIPSGTVRASQPTSPNQTTRPTSTPTSPASPASLQPPKEASLQAKAFLSPASSSASASAAVSPASVSTSGSKRVKAIKQQQQAVEPDTPSSPNLRARISKLFRQSPKQPRPTSSTSSTDQQQERYRDQSKELQQNSTRSAPSSKILEPRQRQPSAQPPPSQQQQPQHQQPLKAQQEPQPQVTTMQFPALKRQQSLGSSFVEQQQKQKQTSPSQAPTLTSMPLSPPTSHPEPKKTEPSTAVQGQSRTIEKALEQPINPTTPTTTTTTPTESPPTSSDRSRSRKVSSIAIPTSTVVVASSPTFAAGFTPTATSPPRLPLTRPDTKARQRRVSSVSSSHSIRQVGTYGGNMSPSKMISPARKANPYYSGVLARFSNGGNGSGSNTPPRHSLHEREHSGTSQSGKRKSVVKVGVELNKGSQEKLDPTYKELQGSPAFSEKHLYQPPEKSFQQQQQQERPPSVVSSTNSAAIQDEKGDPAFSSVSVEKTDDADEGVVGRDLSTPSPAPPPPLFFSATYEEEYDIEKDDSARNSVQGSPYTTKGRIAGFELTPSQSSRALFNTRPTTPVLNKATIYPADETLSTPPAQHQQRDRTTNDSSQDSGKYPSSQSTNIPSRDTTWSVATSAIPTDNGTTPGSITSTLRTGTTAQSYSRVMPSFESQRSDVSEAAHSVSTMSSAQMTRDYMAQGIIHTESWGDDDADGNDHNSIHRHGDLVPPVVLVQRPSMEVSILPEQPPFMQVNRAMSTASSVYSTQSGKAAPQQATQAPKRIMSIAQWSESSYDPCAPIRWDELFEMDPNSKGPLWLSGRSLGQIPHEFFDGLRNLRELYLDHNDIKVVPDSLLKLSKLDVLDLSCNSISSFDAAFKLKKLKNLRRLNLDHNMLTDISPIYKLKSLRELRMNHNFVPFLAIAIQNMAKLKILAMESNSLATLPETMGKLGNLCELRLSDNNLRALPESIGSIRTLQVLALRSNLLEKLPESWKDMENLSTLDLSCNRLTVLPQDIVRLPKLTHLDLHDNQLQYLPEKIGLLSNLVVLQLCNNNLRELPKDIGRLRDLLDLVLSFNQLQFLPEEIGKLNKLQELKFDNNPLRSLPKTIQRLTSIRRVHLQGCELRDLPVELGTVFKELVYLDLSCNQFEVLPALDSMNKLEEFYISNNFLREIGTSSLNLQTSGNNSNNSYNTGTLSGPMGGGIGLANGAQLGVAASAQASLSGATGLQIGTQSSVGTAGNATNQAAFSLTGGGVTASKLSELKRLRIFEARNNQIRVLSSKIKMLPQLEVLDLANNLLNWLPKEVGDLADLKVLVLEGNPIKSLPSSLSKLMGSLEIFRIGDWPDNGFEITREQAQMNMKINVLQSFMPHQIERTLLWRMHDSILRRVQELDSQQYRDQHNLDKNDGSGPTSRALILGSQHPGGASFDAVNTLQHVRTATNGSSKSKLGISQGLAIATQNMMANRSFVLPPLSTARENSTTASTLCMSPESSTFSAAGLLSVNSEGINPNYVDYPSTLRTLPKLQFSSVPRAGTHSAPITSLPMSASPLTATVPSGPLSAFPLLNSLRPRKSQQQLQLQGGGNKNSVSVNAARPKSMFTYGDSLLDLQDQSSPTTTQTRSTLNNRMSRVFDFASGNSRPKHESQGSTSTLESSTLQLSSDAMMALGLGTQPGSAGSVIIHSNNIVGSRLGDGSLLDIKSSMAIKSSPSLTSMPLPLLSSEPGGALSSSANLTRPSVSRASKTSFGRPTSPLPRHVYGGAPLTRSNSESTGGAASAEKSTTSLPWLRLKSSTSPAHDADSTTPIAFGPHERAQTVGTISNVSTATTSSISSLLQQPTVNGTAISAPAPPPILLDYDLDTSASLDIPQYMYYSAGGDDVDGDHPAPSTAADDEEDQLLRLGDGLGIDDDTEEDDRFSIATTNRRRGTRSQRSSISTTTTNNTVHNRTGSTTQSTPRASQDLLDRQHYQQQQQPQQLHHHYQQPQNQLNTTDPVLKIAVLKGIYDQILQNMDHLVEQNVQESPAAKKNRFKLLSTLKFLKADRQENGRGNQQTHHQGHGGSSSGGGSHRHNHQHHGSLSSMHTAQHHLQTMLQ